MAFGAITNLASAQAADEDRKRKEQQAQLSLESSGLKDELLGLKQSQTEGPVGQFDALTHGRKVAIDPGVQQDVEQHRFLDQQAMERMQRRESGLEHRAADLSVAGPSAAERTRDLAAPLGRFATEDASAAAQELKTDPRGRLAQIEAQKEQILGGGVSRETSGSDRFFYREEPNGTLAFTNRPEVAAEPGYRRYNSDNGSHKDLGAPGGGLTSIGKPGPSTDARDALLAGLNELAGEARRQPLTPQEMAGQLVKQEPVWDTKAAELGPVGVHDALNQAVADGSLDPKIAMNLGRKYAGIADDVDQGDGPDPRDFADRLRQGRPPAPGEAQARLEAPSPIPQAQAEEQHAVQGALEAPQAGPGSMRSPALASEGGTNPDALLAEIQGPRGQSMTVPGVGGEVGYQTNAPFIPERMQQIPAALQGATSVARQAAPAPGGEGEADLGAFADLPEELRLLFHGAAFAGGGHEPQAERKRRLAREAARRG